MTMAWRGSGEARRRDEALPGVLPRRSRLRAGAAAKTSLTRDAGRISTGNSAVMVSRW
jgi:hypothetical protein